MKSNKQLMGEVEMYKGYIIDKDKRIAELEEMLVRFLPLYEEDTEGNDISHSDVHFEWNDPCDGMISDLKKVLRLDKGGL